MGGRLRRRVDQTKDRGPLKGKRNVVPGLEYLVGVLEVHDPWHAWHEAAVQRICFSPIREVLALLCIRSGFVGDLPPFNERLNVNRGLAVRLPDSMQIRLPIR
jgi:hypothetical protein